MTRCCVSDCCLHLLAWLVGKFVQYASHRHAIWAATTGAEMVPDAIIKAQTPHCTAPLAVLRRSASFTCLRPLGAGKVPHLLDNAAEIFTRWLSTLPRQC